MRGRSSATSCPIAAKLVGEAADDIVAIDEAMKLGYNWKFGPFELIDKLGPGKLLAERLSAEGRPVPGAAQAGGGPGPFYRIENGKRQYLTADGAYRDVPARRRRAAARGHQARRSQPLLKNGSAALWDVGDGVARARIHRQDERARR